MFSLSPAPNKILYLSFSNVQCLCWVFLRQSAPAYIFNSWIVWLPQHHIPPQHCPKDILISASLPLAVFSWWTNISQALFPIYFKLLTLLLNFPCFSLNSNQAVNTTYWMPAVKRYKSKSKQHILSFEESKIYWVRQNTHSH